ncbi:hypothetical protein PZB74_16165 [Porifericola rhodea]|uniref:hypothetical protein n=1 Tax=Porifericola rhodea TaxID=930972 RepID=UPI0026656EAB|nr:hypothetical protein [Porifericola rhodea]WKN30501.1 hypothetical protein PZB74_16165 [Porifericola rhodea]
MGGRGTMTSTDFEKLPREKKCKYVWNRCNFLATRFHHDQQRRFRINLYHNGRFFVEIWYNSKYDYIGDIFSFTDTKLLDPYLEGIRLKTYQE